MASWRALVASAAVVASCSSESNPADGGDNSDGAEFTAKVDGEDWKAAPISIAARAGGGPGALLFVGTQTVDGLQTTLTVTLNNIRGAGTYALGVGSEVYGGTAHVGEGAGGEGDSWITDNTGVAGTVTLTRIDTRIAGSFEYVAEPGRRNMVGGTRRVTEGKFDLALQGTLPPVPENVGSMLRAKLDGQTYNAWSVNATLRDHLGNPGLQLSTTTNMHGISLVLSEVTEPGTYPLGDIPLRRLTAGRNGGDAMHCCWGRGEGGDTGSITIVRIDAERASGTFSGTIQPQPGDAATAPLVVTEGDFDVAVN